MDDVTVREIVKSVKDLRVSWASRWFWRRRLPGFVNTRTVVRARIQVLVKQPQKVLSTRNHLRDDFPITAYPDINWDWEKREGIVVKYEDSSRGPKLWPTMVRPKTNWRRCYFDILNRPISLDEIILQVMVLKQMGLNYDLVANYHPCKTKWVRQAKADEHDTFEDCHDPRVIKPAWFEIRLVLSTPQGASLDWTVG